ncbi:glycyl-radical enzyme activating protein [Candidatus Neomarinimicrobiota bacterium]
MSKSGIIFDIKKYAIHDGPGIRTTVFFKGCTMGCQWCHNPESKNFGVEKFMVKDRVKKISKNETVGYEITVDEVMNIIKKDKVFYDESNGGATFSGGEPTVQTNFLLEILMECKKANIHTTVDTCGEASWNNFEKIIDYVDLFLYDLKLINNVLHNKYTGVSNKIIHDNLMNLLDIGKGVELRIPLIPDVTDTVKNLDDLIQYISSLKKKPSVILLPYNLLTQDKLDRYCLKNKLGKLKVQSRDRLFSIKQEFVLNGIDANIGG